MRCVRLSDLKIKKVQINVSDRIDDKPPQKNIYNSKQIQKYYNYSIPDILN